MHPAGAGHGGWFNSLGCFGYAMASTVHRERARFFGGAFPIAWAVTGVSRGGWPVIIES